MGITRHKLMRVGDPLYSVDETGLVPPVTWLRETFGDGANGRIRSWSSDLSNGVGRLWAERPSGQNDRFLLLWALIPLAYRGGYLRAWMQPTTLHYRRIDGELVTKVGSGQSYVRDRDAIAPMEDGLPQAGRPHIFLLPELGWNGQRLHVGNILDFDLSHPVHCLVVGVACRVRRDDLNGVWASRICQSRPFRVAGPSHLPAL